MKTQMFGKNLLFAETLIVRGIVSILVVLFLSYSLISCVETAECDETVACVGGKVCYDLKCEDACSDTSECQAPETCEPCLENFGAGISDHCFTDSRMACIVLDTVDE